MKKLIVYFSLLIFIIFTLIYYIIDAKNKNDNFIEIKDHIEKLIIVNKDFDLYLKHKYSYDNFDIIENRISKFNYEFKQLTIHLNNIMLNNKIEELNILINKKIKLINKIKSNRAILNNSFRIIQIIKKKSNLERYNDLYFMILSIDKYIDFNKDERLKFIEKELINIKNDYEKYFLIHAKNTIIYNDSIIKTENKLEIFNIDNILNDIEFEYMILAKDSIKKASYSIVFLFLLLFVVIILYILDEKKLLKSYKELYKFRTTVQNSDNIVMITDINKKITYVNQSFCKTTNYTFDEVIGKTPEILKSGYHKKEFYDNINKTIYSGKQWSGEFKNISKDGKISYERSVITPSFDDNDEIIEFISIKQDITKEKLIQEELIQNEKLIIQQSKMAAMGEMLENIAHQWRQPLSTISTISSGMIVKKDMGIVIGSDKEIEYLNKIINTTKFLSKTIDDFRNFFRKDKVKKVFNIKETFTNSLNIVNSKFKSLGINIIENIEDIRVESYETEIMQVFINILNNAKDALVQNEIKNKFIFIDILQDNDNTIILIKDNASGIKIKPIEKIFEPYFTTKHKSQGTGIGLYMSSEIINKHLNGILRVSNEEFIYDDIKYIGACFKIIIPIIKKENNVK